VKEGTREQEVEGSLSLGANAFQGVVLPKAVA
jgi:hypothetical protein